jgi:hypothetical protein
VLPAESKKVGWMDGCGNYRIEMPSHHVYIDERNFFSRYWFTDRLLKEKESRIEAFSKLSSFLFLSIFLEIIKEINDGEMAKCSVRDIYRQPIEIILNCKALSIDEK